jgi:microcystin-dependent protein
VGSGAGTVSTTGSNNIAVGSQALSAQTTGACNIAIGNLAGLGLTTECNNVILGPATGEVGCNNNVFIASGDGTVRLRFNENGALGIAGVSFGTNGQVLTSAGPGSAPTWTTVGGGTVTSVTGTAPIAVTTGTTPVVSISAASTTASGAVQLYDNVDSTSTTLALTAAQGKNLQDQITALAVNPSITLAGTVNAGLGGIVESVTSAGTTAGYVVSSTLPAADATTNNTYVIVTTPGTMTPPGGSATAATRGDWFLVSETSPGTYAWTFLNVGFDVSYATTASSGVVCLATDAQAQAGTDTITALTPAAAASAYIPKACVTGVGSLITGSAASTPVALPVGADSTFLKANSACPNGLEWVVGMGDTPVGTVNWFAASTAPGGWLVADGSAVSRTTYATLFAVIGTVFGAGNGSTTFNLPDLRGQFIRGIDNGRGCDTGRVFGSSQQDMIECHQHVIPWGENSTSCFGQTNQNIYRGIATGQDFDNRWYYSNNGTNFDGTLNPAGVIGCETRPMNVAMLPCIKWQVTTAPSSCGIPCACITAKGTLVTGNAANSPVSLAVGANGTALVACSTCSEGVTWANVVPANATPTVAGVVLGCTTPGVAALGCNALGANLFGPACGHVALGFCALYSAGSTAYNNIAIGSCSGALTTSGNSNVSIGFCSLALNTTGFQNVAIGDQALGKNTTSGTSTAVGASALACFTGTSVSTNDAFGANSLAQFVCGDYNVSIGGWSMFNAICGNWNTAVGHRALTGVTCACKNAALGLYAGSNITTGCNNVAIGHAVTVPSPTGNCQLAIGFDAGCNWLTGDSSKNIQPGAGIRDCTGSLGVNGQVLTSTGTVLRWQYAPIVYRSTGSGVVSSVATIVIPGQSNVYGASGKWSYSAVGSGFGDFSSANDFRYVVTNPVDTNGISYSGSGVLGDSARTLSASMYLSGSSIVIRLVLTPPPFGTTSYTVWMQPNI